MNDKRFTCSSLRGLFLCAVWVAAASCGGSGDGSPSSAPAPAPVPTPAPAPPRISVQPTAQSIEASARATFSVVAGGDTVRYQWQSSTDEGASWNDIDGAVAASYSVEAASTALNGLRLRVIATNAIGSTASEATPLWVRKPSAPAATLALLAGHTGGLGALDGAGTSARFGTHATLSVDGDGNLLLPSGWDPMGQSPSFRKVPPSRLVTTVVLPDVAPAAAGFNPPYPLLACVTPSGDLLFIAADGGTVRRFSRTGVLTTVWSPPSNSNLSGIAVDGTGNIYVSDAFNFVIWTVAPSGVARVLAGQPGLFGYQDGDAASARFNSPAQLVVDRLGNLFVIDRGTNVVRKVTPSGETTTLAGTPGPLASRDGTGTTASFSLLLGIAIDAADTIYVTEQEISAQGGGAVRRITPAGVVTTIEATRGMEPSAIGIDAAGNVYFLDRGAIRRIAADGAVSTIAGKVTLSGMTDGGGTAARFNTPIGVAADSTGNLYVADSQNHTLRTVSPSGDTSTVAGRAGEEGFIDGTGDAARLSRPFDVTRTTDGGFLFTELGNRALRALLPGGPVSTIVDGGAVALPDGRGLLSQGIAIDQGGTIYFSASAPVPLPFSREFYDVLLKRSPDGAIASLAGTSLFSLSQRNVDGPASQATFGRTSGMALDTAGNLFVADTYNSTIRKITPAGFVSTFAGMPVQSAAGGTGGYADGIASAARFRNPEGLAFDDAGNLYVADTGNHLIRRIASDGTVTTVLSSFGQNGIAVGGNPSLSSPRRIAWLGGKRFAITSGNAVLVATLP